MIWTSDVSLQDTIVDLTLFLDHFLGLQLGVIYVTHSCFLVDLMDKMSLVPADIVGVGKSFKQCLQLNLPKLISIMKYCIGPIIHLNALHMSFPIFLTYSLFNGKLS